MRNEVTVPPASVELLIKKSSRAKPRPTLYYLPTTFRLIMVTKDIHHISYVSIRISPTLEIFFQNLPRRGCDDAAIGFSIFWDLPCRPGGMIGVRYRNVWGKILFPFFRLWHNLTKRTIPAQEALKILGINIPDDAWDIYRKEILNLMKTPVFVRLE